MSDTIRDFSQLDLGTGSPTSVPMETVKVKLSAGEMVNSFAKAFVDEARRKQPLRFQTDPIKAEDVQLYCQYLVYQRVLSVHQSCKMWRKLKTLWVPSFIQFVMSRIGRVVIRDKGLTFMPFMDFKVKDKTDEELFQWAAQVSELIAAYEDSLQMVQDAMPRGIDGDPDVMTSALIASYVRSIERMSNPTMEYVAAFMNFQLEKDCALSALYRVQYDDINFITTALLSHRIV